MISDVVKILHDFIQNYSDFSGNVLITKYYYVKRNLHNFPILFLRAKFKLVLENPLNIFILF